MFVTAPIDNITSTKDWPRHSTELLNQYAWLPPRTSGTSSTAAGPGQRHPLPHQANPARRNGITDLDPRR